MLCHLKSLCSQNAFNSQKNYKTVWMWQCHWHDWIFSADLLYRSCRDAKQKLKKCFKKEKASRQQMHTSMLKVQSDFIPVDRYTFPVLSRDYYKIFPSLFVFLCLCGVLFTVLNAPVEYFPLNAVILLFCSLYLFHHHRKCYFFMIGWFHKNWRNVKVILHTKCVLLKENKSVLLHS